MGRSKTRSNIFKKTHKTSSSRKKPTTQSTPNTTPSVQNPTQSSALGNVSSGVTTGIGMGLGMEAARIASNTLFNTNSETHEQSSQTREHVNQQIVGSHNCEDLLKDLKLCLNAKKSLIDCDGILDRYHRCLRNEY